MITIELLGGARKSFPDGAPQLDTGTISLDEALRRVCDAVPDGGVPLELKNSLVALNGVDSSALDNAVVRDGDTITIIPIVHGGQGSQKRFCVSVARIGRSAEPGELLDSLRAEFPRLAIQLVRQRLVLGAPHARRIAQVSIAAERRGELLSQRLETDMLLRFANTLQISQAIEGAGVRAGQDAVLVAVGTQAQLERLRIRTRALGRGAAKYATETAIRRSLGISAAHIRAVGGRRPLEDILVERAAVLC